MRLPKIIDYKLKQKSPESELAKYVARLEKVLEKSAEEANNRFGEYLRQLLDKSRREEEKLTEAAQQRLNEYVEAMQKDVAAEIKADMETIKRALTDYQRIRMAQIEENLAETIQRAAELYLGKKLDPETHMELIYESLEKAKREKLITV
jgi:F0F1-type ATP synthase membrane subunit b/b'